MHKTTRSRPHLALALVATCTALLLLGGCGGSSGGGDSVAHLQGGPGTVSRPMLGHWMRAMAGGDFRAIIGTKAPAGLVSEPADYPQCEAAAKKIVPRTDAGQLKLSDAQISTKCHQLYRSIKAQALTFLLSVQWIVREGEELGLKLSDAELHKEFARFRQHTYPTEADLKRYLEERHWALSDILYQLKRNVLVSRILPKFEAKVQQAGGGEAVYARLALERYKRQISQTVCKPGYVAPGCSEYRGPETVSPAPNAILEGFTEGVSS